MNVEITSVPPTIAGALTIQEIEHVAHEDDPIGPLLWPGQTPSDPAKESKKPAFTPDMQEAERMQPFLKDSNNFFFLATDVETSQPVGYVWWKHQPGRTPEQWADTYANRYRPDEMNKALMDATSGERFQRGAKIIGNRPVLVLRELHVRPECQRRGIGGKLVAWGVKKAEELAVMGYTEASVKGHELYVRHGFRQVDCVRVDLEPWGGEKGEASEYTLLVRD